MSSNDETDYWWNEPVDSSLQLVAVVCFHSTTVLCLIGVVINLLAAIALLKKSFKFNLMLRHLFVLLNFSNMGFLTCTFLLFSAPKLFPAHQDLFTLATPYTSPLNRTFAYISIYSVVAIAVQGIIHVFNSQRDQTRAPSWCSCALAILLIVGFGIGYNVPVWMEMGIDYEEIVDDDTGYVSLVPFVKPSHMRMNEAYVLVYQLGMSALFGALLPILVLASAIVYFMKMMNRCPKQTKRVVKILLVNSLMFLVCCCFRMTLVILNHISYQSTWVRIIRDVTQVLVVTYAALNPLSYCLLPLLKKAFCQRCHKETITEM